ncbi:hypothetical protein L9F63_006159, partial [Diploptera punctata]
AREWRVRMFEYCDRKAKVNNKEVLRKLLRSRMQYRLKHAYGSISQPVTDIILTRRAANLNPIQGVTEMDKALNKTKHQYAQSSLRRVLRKQKVMVTPLGYALKL